MVISFAAARGLCFSRLRSSRLVPRLIRRPDRTNPPPRLESMTAWRKVRANPEHSASPSASHFNERLKKFTGVTVFGRKENPDSKPSLNAVMSQAHLEKKVEGYLRDSLMLEDYWQKPVAAEQLQAEMDRIARDTKQPKVLSELFEALGNDPAVIAECLARPLLAQRLITDLSVQSKARRFEPPQANALRTMWVTTRLGQFSYTLPKIADAGDPPCTDDTWTATTIANAPLARYRHRAVWTGSEMIIWGGVGADFFNTGVRYNPDTDSWIPTSTTNAPSGRGDHTAVWTGSEMIVWGGIVDTGFLTNTGGRYCAQSGPTPPTPTPCMVRRIPTPRPRPTPAPRP